MQARALKSGLLGGLLLVASGCVAGSAASSAANVALNTALAVGASAASRASGGCYANCPPGTTCDATTGMCQRQPCRGECGPNEECIEGALSYRCVVVTPPDGNIFVKPKETKSEPR